MKYLSFILFFLVFTTSCNNDNKRYNPLFNYELKSFKKEFINHFPKITNTRFSYSITKKGEYVPSGVILYEKENSDFYSSLHDSIIKIAKASYKSSDKCLFVINMFTTEKNIFSRYKADSKELEILKDSCLIDKYPVPNFYDRDTIFNTRCKLSKNFDLFVLDAKSGIFWDKKHLTDGKFMPEKWKHGYSKGIAMNSKTYEVIYWFQIW